MGRFIYWMNVSLDMKVEQVPGDHGAGEWLRIDEELHEEFNAQARDLEMMVQGRVFYEIMEAAWPQYREDASLPQVMRDYGEIWTTIPKALVSRTRGTADFNTRVIGGDAAIEALAALRATTEGRISVGGVDIATQLLRAGLLDELLLFVHPSILGFGRPLFDDYDRPIDLHPTGQKTFSNGVTMLRFDIQSLEQTAPARHDGRETIGATQ